MGDLLGGTRAFDVGLRLDGGAMSALIDLEGADGTRQHVFPGGWAPCDPDRALATLTRGWPRVAGDFAPGRGQRGSFDLASLASVPFPPRHLVSNGTLIWVDMPKARVDFRRSSVVVVETLLGLGDELARHAHADTRRDWREAAAATELPSLPLSRADQVGSLVEQEVMDAAQWYADRLGQGWGRYVIAATWLHARQVLSARGHGTEPTDAERDVETIPATMPTMKTVSVMSEEAARAQGMSTRDFVNEAVAARNVEARFVTVHERWYGSARKRSAGAERSHALTPGAAPA